ncbi:unnamed protein product [Rotaria sp. Silwood1]|nr:unnamed protein product [Rotaria sp. Silwood1]CAF1572940.1 unnamed protein product [Rotaria sp. Silwood1]CAF3589733.1 unnamed protein product [Rotaria sp. Silwood1]CAF3636295.1 unnamed protein product [Rotaria sp. Silwood1]CAF3658521.1 unnamed protein product [Rotaria sp. Silwood1]
MALHLLEATLTQGPSCSADDIAELEIHVRNEIERYIQLEIERELFELIQSTTNDTLLTSTICSTYLSNGEINNETSKKRIKTDSDVAKTSAKINMELDQQLTELKNKYLTKIAEPLSTLEALKLIIDKKIHENNQLENEILKLKQLYNEYNQYDEYSMKMLENIKILNQTQLTVSKHELLLDLKNSNDDNNNIDIDQFEQLSTLLLHKILHLPLIDMKAKHLHKPEHK